PGGMVEIYPLSEEDETWLRDVVVRHGEVTGSAVAARLLGTWARTLRDAVKVMPRDYRRVLEATERALAQGRPVDEAVMASSAHG
ncbi:MAG: hypothetical protein ACRDXC_07145, partial [Acidimicrobiales bacterium]